MSTNPQGIGNNGIDPSVLLGAAQAPKPRRGERAAMIRYFHHKYPELSNTAIAQRVGCDSTNVDQVLRRYLGTHSVADLREYQANEPDILDAVRMRSIASITDEDIAKAPFLARVTGAAILLDKSRLLNGQPTSIHVTALVDLGGLLRSEQASDE